MVLDFKVCKKCNDTKLLMNDFDLPTALIDNIKEYFQCSECDIQRKKQIINEKRRDYYRDNKERIIERSYCNRLLKQARAFPINLFIIAEMEKRLAILKGKSDMELYWSSINHFMMEFSERYPGV